MCRNKLGKLISDLENLEISEEKKSYYEGYIYTTVGLEIIPYGKIKKLKDGGGELDSEEIKKLKELLKEWKKKFKNRVQITDVSRKIRDRIEHIMKVDIKTRTNGTKFFTGVHSIKAIENHPHGARIELLSEADRIRKKNNQPYNAKVYAKDSNGNEILKSGGEGISTFFPDNWSEEKILEEVEYAVKYNCGRFPGGTIDEHFGISKSGLEIHFYLKPDGSIKSYFPKIVTND